MRYSPCGKYLAIGSHDNNIYIYEGTSLHATLKGHSSFIVALDWSQDSDYIRSNCGAHELLFWNITDGKCGQDKNGKSNTVPTIWATKTVLFGWHVDGIFPSGTDGNHINGVGGSADGSLIVTADNFGLVNIFRDPVRNGGKPRSYRGHSEHTVRAYFSPNDEYIFSVGGYD